MYLFSRRRSVGPAHARPAATFGADAGKRATAICGLDISTWITIASTDTGLMSWATMVEHMADIEAATDKLAVDDAFNEFVERNDGLFSGPVTDVLFEVVSGAPEPAPVPPAYALIIETECANGRMAAAMAGGVEMAAEATRLCGLPVMFLTAVTGAYGAVSWIFGAPDLATIEAARAALNGDAAFGALIDRHGPSYRQGGLSTIHRRIG